MFTRKYIALYTIAIAMFLFGTHSVYTMDSTPKNNTNAGNPYQRNMLYRMLGAIGQSAYMDRLSVWQHKEELAKTNSLLNRSQAAAPELQKLGAEMQTAVGIPEERQVHIRTISPWPMTDNVPAFARSGAMYVHPKFQQIFSYDLGAQRSVFGHEAIHIKYHDNATTDRAAAFAASTTFSAATMISFVAFSKSLYYSKKIHLLCLKHPKLIVPLLLGTTICSSATGAAAARNVEKPVFCGLWRFNEQRADTEGYYATQCATCVEHFARYRNDEADPKGYLCAKQIKMIAKELQEDGKLCSHHADELD